MKTLDLHYLAEHMNLSHLYRWKKSSSRLCFDEIEIKIAVTIRDKSDGGLKSVDVVIPLIRRVETVKEAEHVMVEMFFEAKRALAV